MADIRCAVYLFFSLLLTLSVRNSCGQEDGAGELSGQQSVGDGDVTGKSGSEERQKLYRKMCRHMKSNLEDIMYYYDEVEDVFLDFKKRYEAIGKDKSEFINEKAIPAHKGSMCPVNITCCTSKMEKEIAIFSRNEFKKYYNGIINTHVQSCPASGKRLFKSSRLIMDVIMRNLEVRLNQSLEGSLPDKTLANLTIYLSYFSAIADTCPLQKLLQDQLENLLDVTLAHLFADNAEFSSMLDDPISMDCMRNTSMELVKDYYTDILPPMQRQLHDLGQFVRALKVADHALNAIRGHTLSDSCVTAIVRMQYCSMCGGFGRFPPCLNLCMNTLRGCFADLAEIHGPFKDFTALLRTLSVSLLEDLKPDNFVDKYLKQFVGMVEYLKQNEDALEEKLTQECSMDDYDAPDKEVTQSRKRRSIFQPVQESTQGKAVDPLVEQLDFKDMATVMEAEIGCLERLAEKIGEVPEDICVFENKISHGGNTNCWTGNALGEYHQSQVGELKRDQLQNPVYSKLSMETEILYSSLLQDINATSTNLGRTIAFRERCQESDDDEDCSRVLYNQCFNEPEDKEDMIGSGSGSLGSGSGSGFEEDGMEDYEIPTAFSATERSTRVTIAPESTSGEVTEKFTTEPPTTDSFTISTMVVDSDSQTTETPSAESTSGATEENPTVGSTEGRLTERSTEANSTEANSTEATSTEATPTEGTTVKPFLFNNQLGGFLPSPQGAGQESIAKEETEQATTTRTRQTTPTQQMTTTQQQTQQMTTTTQQQTPPQTTTSFTNHEIPTAQVSDNIGEIVTDAKDISGNKLPENKDSAPKDRQGTESKVTESHQSPHTEKVANIISSSASLHSVNFIFGVLPLLVAAATTAV